ncbi:sugar ABC transporter substrate-binding protein [Neobacillus cucumis]|uniref:ABC transporter substrate-binding protein n=1 Tax=Neobacillus cucumis TaxID=1740721 RepID=UPI002E1B24F6|nr:sugar ABC transporter substrate-binding protein [Neobacillus cucumis]
MKKMKLLLISLVSVFLLIGMAGCSSSDKASTSATKKDPVELRFAWWGDTKRNEVYNAIADQFEQEHPNIKIKREASGWGDYWQKLSTQTAGGNAPDVFGMHASYVSDYANRNTLLKMDSYVTDKTIDQSNFPKAVVNSGKINGNLYMIAQGVTMTGFVYNPSLFDKLGVAQPAADWTWDDFAKTALALKAKGITGSADMGGGALQPQFRYFLRQNGQDLFTEDGKKLAFDKETLVKWWSYWDDLRKKGGVPTAETSTEYQNAPLEQSLFVTGKIAMQQIPANQLYLYQQQIKDGQLKMAKMPALAGGKRGEYIEGAYLSVSAKSKHPKEAAEFINFFVNSEKSLKLFKVEQGSPGSTKMADYVKPLLEPAQKDAVDFIQETLKVAKPAAYPPMGIAQIEQAYKDDYNAISFGKMSVKDAADKFMNEAKTILNQ